jgi:hypothetical protein
VTTSRLSRYLVGTFALCYLSAIALTGCGSTSSTSDSSNSSGSSTTTLAPATATACAQMRANFRPITGTVQSISGQTVHITQSTGGSINAAYTNTTRITQQTLGTNSALQAGSTVNVQVQPNSNGTYTATTITLTQGGQFGQGANGAGQGQGGNRGTGGGQGRGAGACFGGRRGANGGGANGGGQTSGRNRITGTVGQVTGTTLTIKDRQQNTYNITLAPDTKIIQTSTASASAIQTGMGIRVMGSNDNGVITATSITVYAAGLMPNPTPTTSNP